LSESDEKEINISYETLFDLLRREKERGELQKLTSRFMYDVAEYIKGKNSLLKKNRSGAEELPISEKQRVVMHLQNIRKILRDLYNRRESKILIMAQNKSKTHSTIVDNAAMLDEEKTLFESLTAVLDRCRRNTMTTFFATGKPFLNLELFMDNDIDDEQMPEEHLVEKPRPVEIEKRETTPIKKVEDKEEKKSETLMIRFLESIPKFVGRDLKVYGPFRVDDMANLPSDLATILISKGKAEEINVD